LNIIKSSSGGKAYIVLRVDEEEMLGSRYEGKAGKDQRSRVVKWRGVDRQLV
jgi:hypothetical protein